MKMGRPGFPLYGNVDLGSAIEEAELIIGKIKTNEYDDADVVALKDVLEEIVDAIENKD